MKNLTLKTLSLSFVAALLLGSCARDNSVVSNNRIQKRKHSSGFHIDKNKKYKTVKQLDRIDETNTALIIEEDVVAPKAKQTPSFETISVETKDQLSFNDEISEETTDETNYSHSSENLLAEVEQEEKSISPFFETKKVKKEKSNKTIIRKLDKHKMAEKSEKKAMRVDSIVYILLCIFLPPVAVGLATNWDPLKTILALVLTIFFWLPGMIYAFYVCDKEGVI